MTQEEFEKEWKDDSEFVECHTSGSTGKPKEIRLSKDFMRQSALRTNEFFKIDSKSHLHTCLDFQYIASKMMTVRADMAHCRLTSENASNHPLGNISVDEKISLLSVVPSQMLWILDNIGDLPEVGNILVGGSPIPSMIRSRISLSGLNVWESYGMTESASHIALRNVTDDDAKPFETLPGITVKASDDGCLVVMMPGIEIIKTNDLAEVISATEFRILGRSDNCIISGGIKIIPEMLEEKLGSFIAFNYCISSMPDAKWGERLVLVVEKEDSCLPDDIIKKAVGIRLEQFKKSLNLGPKSPKEVVVVDKIPLTSSEKIDRPGIKSKIQDPFA